MPVSIVSSVVLFKMEREPEGVIGELQEFMRRNGMPRNTIKFGSTEGMSWMSGVFSKEDAKRLSKWFAEKGITIEKIN